MSGDDYRLVADIGGTNARFAVARDGRVEHLRLLSTAAYPTMQAAARDFLSALPAGLRPRRAALDFAGPVEGDQVSLTNSAWSFSIEQARAELGMDELLVLNDFAAAALGIPYLPDEDLRRLGGGQRVPTGPIGVIGPGTGLGVASLLPVHGEWVVIPGEGGHVTMAPSNAEESRILDRLREQYGHASAERVLSGQGLENLYETLGALEGTTRHLAAAEITQRAGTEPDCTRTLELFFAMLGTVAGNLALTLGATGGVFVTGGIAPRCAEFMVRSAFRERFEQKGRLSPYVQNIATYLVVNANPALIGLAHYAGRQP